MKQKFAYLSLMRPDHWFKNLFIVPGYVLAHFFYKEPLEWQDGWRFLWAAMAVCLVASANYIINEYLDAQYDTYHPIKKHRALVQQPLPIQNIVLAYLLVLSLGLGAAYILGQFFFVISLLFLCMGIIYNVAPLRAKERPLWDVTVESINNPIRLALGWYAYGAALPLPPMSLLLAYWMGGAFLMFAKRFAEYRFIGDPQQAARYRHSFAYYNEPRLLVALLFAAVLCSFFMGVFLMKHKVELILSFPFLAALFAWYLQLAFRKDSSVQYPERLFYKAPFFMSYVVAVMALCYGLLYLDWPWLVSLLQL